jgi:hypothetical protein
VKDYGAVGDGVTDDSAAIQMAIDSLPGEGPIQHELILGAGGTVFFPTGVYRVANTIRVERWNVALLGEGVDATTLLADASLYTVVRFGNATAVPQIIAINCSIERMTIDRQEGAIPIGATGILWDLFQHGYERSTRVNRHYYGRRITGGSEGASVYYSLYEPQSSNVTRAHMAIVHAAGIKVFGGVFGRTPEEFDYAGMIEIGGIANDVTFTQCTFIPGRRPATAGQKPGVILINGMTVETGVYRFVDCKTENTSVGFTSDQFTPRINGIEVLGGRWAVELGMFNFNPNTRVEAMKLTGAEISTLEGQVVGLVNAQWLVISGCLIGGASAFFGGPQADMTITGNRFLGSVFLGGAFRTLMFTGNVHNGLNDAMDMSSGRYLVGNNLESDLWWGPS